jgi:hypothetical protein
MAAQTKSSPEGAKKPNAIGSGNPALFPRHDLSGPTSQQVGHCE